MGDLESSITPSAAQPDREEPLRLPAQDARRLLQAALRRLRVRRQESGGRQELHAIATGEGGEHEERSRFGVVYILPMQIADRWMKATNFGEERVDQVTQQVAFGAVEDFALSTGYFDNVRIWFNNKVVILS